jgi:HD superfamily phosphohydrolase YqeK
MNLLFKQIRLIPPIQFLQPFSHCLAAGSTQIAMVTVRMVDSQKGQQVASQLHDLPRRI